MAASIEANTPEHKQSLVPPSDRATTPVSDQHAGLDQEPRSSLTLADCEEPEFNPFSTAKPCSPFYLYNHDSPRLSTDQRQQHVKPAAINISIQNLDLEKAQSNLPTTSTNTPRLSQEKQCNADTGILRIWNRKGKKQCMTKPKQNRCTAWLASLSKWQRLALKLAIALVLIGAIVGIAVGVSVRVGGGVYKGTNTTSTIGS